MTFPWVKPFGKQKSYSPLKFSDDDDEFGVYAISAVPYPSHIRTLLPASENHMLEFMALERARRRLRNIIITLAIFAVCATLVSVSLVLSFQQRKDDVTTEMSPAEKRTWKTSKLKTIITQITTHNSSYFANSVSRIDRLPPYITKSRTKCVRKCWAYAAFRFRATCDNGYCACDAPKYDHLTCLPVVDDCNIRKSSEANAEAVLKGKKQVVFHCKSGAQDSSRDLHILSIFGNHRSLSTTVDVTGNTSQTAILALVSYHPIAWRLRIHAKLHLKQVILVSYNHLPHTSIVFENTDDKEAPEVLRLYSQTGYGEDRYGGHTPLLLENIQRNFGRIKSFTGTSHADEWHLDVS